MTNTNRAAVPAAKQEKTVLSEGTRSELERYGHAVSPFSGALLVGTPDNYREVEQAEYNRVAREQAQRSRETKESNLL